MGSFLFYISCVGFALGIFARSFFPVAISVLLWLVLLGFVSALIAQKNKKTSATSVLFGASLFLVFVLCGVLRMEFAFTDESEYESKLSTRVSLTGEVVREPDVRTASQHLYVKAKEELLLVIADRHKEISYGDIVAVEGELQKPVSFETELGRTFNYEGYLRARGVTYVVPFAKVEVKESGQGNTVLAGLLHIKHLFMSNIERAIPEPHVGLAKGLLLGVKQSLGEDLETAFRKTGIMHIVVLSGYNIMLVVVCVMYLFSIFLPLRGRLVFGAVAIICFALMVGLSATVVRASTMAVLILIAKGTGRTYAVVRALCITGAVMLLYNPYLLAFDVGFQLSFLATLGLILVVPHVEKRLGFVPTIIGVREFLTTTIAAQLFVTPLLLYQVGEFSLVAVLVNVLVLPMVPVAMLLTFATGIVGFASISLSLPFAYLAYFSLAYIILIAETFARVPFSAFVVPPFPFVVVVFAYGVFAALLYRVHTYVKTRSALKGWTILDEETLSKKKLPASPAVPVPIFFR